MTLTATSALAKDQRNASKTELQHRHYAVIAGIIADLDANFRETVATHFANKLTSTNARFDRTRFLRACTVEHAA